jgi:cell division protease FtsH
MKKVPLADGIEPGVIARGTPGFSGADLANLVNEAALFAARRNQRLVTMEELELAKDKIMMGAERKTMVMNEKEKLNTAYHESGHAIVGRLMPEHDPVYKVSIIPRGRALGVTMFLPEEDKYSHSKRFLISSICSLFGGRIAEELTLGFEGVTTGASNDIERATQLARNMVTKWGLSEKLGPLQYDTESEEPFLGRSAGQSHTVYSPETAQRIDEEVRNIIDSCYEKAKVILVENREKLDLMAEALMKYETIDRFMIDDIMEGRPPRPPKGWNDDGRPGGGVTIDQPETSTLSDDDGRDSDGTGHPAGEH